MPDKDKKKKSILVKQGDDIRRRGKGKGSTAIIKRGAGPKAQGGKVIYNKVRDEESGKVKKVVTDPSGNPYTPPKFKTSGEGKYKNQKVSREMRKKGFSKEPVYSKTTKGYGKRRKLK